MKNLLNFWKFFLLCTVFITNSIFSRELTFLPTYVIGTAPENLTTKDRLEEGISELLAFYATDQFEVEATDFDKLRNYLDSDEEEKNRKPSRSQINGVCSEFEPDYIVHSEIDFESTPVIITEIINCRGKVIYSSENQLGTDFYAGMQKHAQKAFAFLNPKSKKDPLRYGSNKKEFIFAIDTSGSIASDTKLLIDYINSITGTPNIAIGLIVIQSKGVKVTKPSFDHSEVRNQLSKITLGGTLNLETLSTWLLKARQEIAESKISKRNVILLTDATGGGDPYKFISALQTYKQIGFQVHLVTGSFFDFKEFGNYRKAARATGGDLYQLTHFRKVGTPSGFKTVYLYDRTIYVDDSGLEYPSDLNLSSLDKISEFTMNSLVPYPHPSNMADVYLKSTKQKSIELTPIKSNVNSVVDRIINSGNAYTNLKAYRKVLIKAGSTSVWVYLKDIEQELLNKEISVKLFVKKDLQSSLGFSNIPEESFVHVGSTPLLLVLSPKEIKYYLHTLKKDSLTCFMKGKVLEIK